MKIKKLISGISALAVAASAFAGLAVTANAETSVIVDTITYDDADAATKFTASARFANNIADSPGGVNTTKCEFMTGSGSSNGYGYYVPLSDDQASNKIVNFEFDMYFNGRVCNLSLSAGGSRAATTAGRALTFSYNNNDNTVKIGNSTTFGNVTTVGAAKAWLHVVADVNNVTKSTALKVYNMSADGDYSEATPTYSADVAFSDNTLAAVKGFDFFAPTTVGLYIDNIKISTSDIDVTMRKVTYSVEGVESDEYVIDGNKPTNIPETVKEGYIFKGWNKDNDTETFYTAAQIADMAITADTTFTAVFEEDAAYIEPIATVEFNEFPSGGKLVAGEDENTAASNPISVKVTGNLGTDLLANPDTRVAAPVVTYELKGFRWIASQKAPSGDVADNIYCDSYGELVVANNAADFKVKNHPFNYYGQIVATVTYNGETKTVSKPLAYIGNDSADVNQILPRGGYESDLNAYSPDMVGYIATTSADNKTATDIVTDNWASYGGNTRYLSIAEDDGGRFYRLTTTGSNSSTFAANQIAAVTDTQVVFDQMVRFHKENETILLKTANPVTWNDNATSFTVTFNGSALNINGAEICTASTNEWYNIIVNSDVSAAKCYAVVKDKDGNVLGTSDVASFNNVGSKNPTYYMFRGPDKATSVLDFNDVKIYRAAIDANSMDITSTGTTISIPEEGTATTTLTVDAKTTEGYKSIGTAVWSFEGEPTGITIEPAADDTHTATVTVDKTASAGTVTVNASIGGVSKSIELTVSSSKDSIKFATPLKTSVSIPLDDTASVVEYAATVINGDGEDIAGKTVTLELYDANNVNKITTMPSGVSFENGTLTVTKDAVAGVYTLRATGTNSENEEITNSVKITLHGLAFDFGAGTEEDVVDGYTSVTPTTSYSEARGYGISSGTVTVGGAASIEDPTADYIAGNPFTFKAKVQKGKNYTVEITYQGTLTTGYVNSDLAGYTLGTQESFGRATYTVAVPVDILDLTVSGEGAKVAAITITKNADKAANIKPDIHHVGDSTAANNGSWAYHIDHNRGNYPALNDIATFYNNGAGGRNLGSYYTEGKLGSVLRAIEPGDIVMFGNNGTNGMGSHFEEDVNYYLDAAEAMGAKIIINSYTPHGALKSDKWDFTWCYDSDTNTFNGWRQDSYDVIVRKIAEERAVSDPNYLGFVEIGKNADAAFNAYVADYAKNGHASADAAAQAIIACFSDHNHYSNSSIARDLMLNGYDSTIDSKHYAGIVEQIVAILSGDTPEPPTPVTYTVTFVADGETVDTKTVNAGETVADIPTVPEKDGYTGKWMIGNDEFTSETVINADTEVTAVYTEIIVEPTTYTVTFKAEGADDVTRTVESGKTVTDIPAVPTKEGYTGKWMIGNDEFTAETVINADTEVTAVYTENTQPVVEEKIDVKSKALNGKTLTAEISNTTKEAVNIAAMVAVYDTDGKLVKVTADQKEVAADGTATFNTSNDAEGVTVKAFIWNVSQHMTPLAEVIIPAE